MSLQYDVSSLLIIASLVFVQYHPNTGTNAQQGSQESGTPRKTLVNVRNAITRRCGSKRRRKRHHPTDRVNENSQVGFLQAHDKNKDSHSHSGEL